MSEVRVAVVDSGIHAAHPHVRGVSGGVAFDADGVESSDYTDRLGHGTAVAAAIRDLAPASSLLAVRVFDRRLTASVASLVAGIEWSLQHSASLINLSLGVAAQEHADAMQSVVDEANRRGAVIVAAGEHQGVKWLPGTLDGVLRVELDWSCSRRQCTWRREDGSVVFRTSGYPRSIPGVDPDRNLKGLSFAVANMTGLAAAAVTEKRVSGLRLLAAALQDRFAGSPAS